MVDLSLFGYVKFSGMKFSYIKFSGIKFSGMNRASTKVNYNDSGVA